MIAVFRSHYFKSNAAREVAARLIPRLRVWMLFGALALAALPASLRAAATATQTFTLQPGWNAIFLEVQPVDQSPAVVFNGVPIEQVWSYFPTLTPLEFITDPSDGLWNVAGWNVYLPPSHPDAAVLTDLFAIQAGQAYLVKITGTSAVTLSVTGEPVDRAINWKPDSFTLTGVAVDPAAGVRSGDFFFNSTAHKAQPRFRLDPNGTWTTLNDNSLLVSGRAYWIFSKGASDFTAPLEVGLGGTGRLDFGHALESQPFTITNRSANTVTVSLANPAAYPLVIAGLDAGTGAQTWTPLTTLTRSLVAGESVTLEVGLRRAGLPAVSDALLTVTAQGIRRRVPVSAENPAPASTAGLWVGTVTLKAVSEPNKTVNPQTPTATPAEMNFRILLHVATGGTVKLLKEAILMKQPNPPGNPPVAGALVLLSNPALIPQFQAPANRDGAPFAYRLSSIGYDFGTAPDLALSGAFGGTLAGTIQTLRTDATNPFKHRYHPDHDDLDANYQTPVGLPDHLREVPEISRALQMTFAAVAPGDLSPEAGYSIRNGTYQETVTGLHKNAIVTTGTFTLRRLNTLGQINPPPAP